MPDNHSQFNYPPILQEASSASFCLLNHPAPPVSSGPADDLYRETESIRLASSFHHQTSVPRAVEDSPAQCSGCVFAPQGRCSGNVPTSASGFPRSKTYCHIINIKSKQEQQQTPPPQPQVSKSFSVLPYSKTS